MPEKKPDKTTLEGMIFHANDILQHALSAKIKGIPEELFENCQAIAIVSMVQVGLMFSDSEGTGILVAKTTTTPEGEEATTTTMNKWSPPIAVKVSGVGFGLSAGVSVQHIVTFLMKEDVIEDVLANGLVLEQMDTELTVGRGRAAIFGTTALKRDAISLAFTKGLYANAVGFGGTVLVHEERANELFYGKDVVPRDVLKGKVAMPQDKVTMIDEVYATLSGPLVKGETVEEASPEEETKKTEAASTAAKAAEEANKSEDIIHVDKEEGSGGTAET